MLIYAPTLKNYALWALMMTTAGWLTLTFGLALTAEIIMVPVAIAVLALCVGKLAIRLMNAPFMRQLGPAPAKSANDSQDHDFSKVSGNSYNALIDDNLTLDQRALVAYDPQGENLYEMVKHILEAHPAQFPGMRLKKPGEWFGIDIYICDDAEPNAFAFGVTKGTSMICVTTGLLRLLKKQDGTLDKRALEAVLAHELGHIKHRHVLQNVLMNILDAIVKMGELLRKPAPLLGQLLSLFAYAEFMFSSFSRQCEYMADATAVKCGYKSDLKRGLAKMDEGHSATVGNTNTHLWGWIVRVVRGCLTLQAETFHSHPSVKNRFLAIKAESARYKAQKANTTETRSVLERLKSEAREAMVFELKSIASHFTSDAGVLRATINDSGLSKEDRKNRLPS